MAKKKTENIKAAPVLRADVGSDQPTPTPEQTGTRTYQIMDPWKDRDVVNLVDVKAVDGEITEVKVNGQPAGGGGGGDLTTAKLTFVYNKVCEMTTLLPAILKSGDTYPGSSTTGDHIEGGIEFSSSYNPASLDVPLYKGKLSAYLYPNGVTISVSGDATWDSGTGVLTVTGDCTITIS
mgnify:CR=1 FL=1